MSDPEETPEQAINRLTREIAQLRRLRAQVPMLILEPYVEAASEHIREVAARMTVKAEIPASLAMEISRSEQQEATRPEAPAPTPPEVPEAGSRVILSSTGEIAVVIGGVRSGRLSPEKWEVLILTEAGRVVTVAPEDLAPAKAGVGAVAPTAPKLAPGARVKIKTSGKTGYVSEVAELSAIVALDEGGFLTVPIADLEPL